jgi:peptidoglycan/LPS O-acetylase OafA/YrhL
MRAFAVLMVAGVHTHPRLVPGGGIGVDVFFVLSGFLITTLLVEELDRRDHIAFARFYARRALRLLPALAGLLFVVSVWATFVATPHTRHQAYLEVLAAATYSRNLTVWSHVPGTLLGHTWTLAVEEQFYLVWPLVLTLVLRARRSAMAVAFAFVAVFILFGTLRVRGLAGPGLLLLQRPEALLLGAALALVRREHGHLVAGPTVRRWGVAGTVAGALGLLALAAWDGADRFDSIGSSLAAVCTVVLIAGLLVLDGRGPARPFVAGPTVAFGRVSYGFYLWHMPVLRWTDDRLVGRSAFVRLPLGLGLALLATLMSYRFLELPALRLKARFRSPATRAEPAIVPQ